jgi:hypothetical protein
MSLVDFPAQILWLEDPAAADQSNRNALGRFRGSLGANNSNSVPENEPLCGFLAGSTACCKPG